MVHPVTPKSLNPIHTSSPMSAARPSQESFTTTLVSAKQGTIKEYFSNAWTATLEIVSRVFEVFLWCITCGKNTSTKIEIAQEIIDDPKGMAEHFASKPEELMAELAIACFVDPVAVEALRSGNSQKVGEFARTLKEGLTEDHATLKTGLSAADKKMIEDKFFAFILTKPLQLLDALAAVQKQVAALLNSELDTEHPEIASLKTLFVTYLPKVIAYGKKNPGKLDSILTALVKNIRENKEKVPEGLKKIPELNVDAEIKALEKCLKDRGFALRALEEPHVLGFKEAPSLKLFEAIGAAFLKSLSPEDIDKASALIEKDHSLIHRVLDDVRGLFGKTALREKIGNNYQAAWTLFQALNQDYLNPPKAEVQADA